MIYRGQFKDINNKLYTVDINTGGSSTVKEITLAGNPFTTAMDSSDKTLYAPIKCQSGTVRIITPDYNFDIYSAKAQGTKVTLTDESGKIIWVGFVTPNLYDMGFVEDREEIEIEAIDALSTLQYIKYNSDNKKMLSFLEIIRKILKSCTVYTQFFISNNIQLDRVNTGTILDKLYISEFNFFDKKEDKETDEDVALTMQEVLQEICQYLGVTAVADGDKVYFLDYDAIKKQNNNYYRYDINSTANPTLVTMGFKKTITATDYSDTGATLSLDQVFNKVEVEADIYNISNIFPDLYDLSNLEKCNFGDDKTLTNIKNKWRDEQRGIEVFTTESGSIYAINFIQYFKFKESDNIKCINYIPDEGVYADATTQYYYTFTPQTTTKTVTNWNRKECDKSLGCCFIKYYTVNCTEKRDNEDGEAYLEREYNNITSLSFKDAILISIPDNVDPPTDGKPYYPGGVLDANLRTKVAYEGQQPILQLKSELLSVNKDTDILIGGKFTFFQSKIFLPYDCSKASDSYSGLSNFYNTSKPDIPFIIKFGDWYYTGKPSQGKKGWVKEPTVAYLLLDVESGKLFGQSYDIKDVTKWYDRTTDETGYVLNFPIDDDSTLCDQLEITLFRPFGIAKTYPARYALLEDFKVKIIANEDIYSIDGDNDSNTVYTNIIDDDFVNQLSTIKFKICTWDNKKPNYSSVLLKDDDGYKYLDRTYNLATYAGEQAWATSDNNKPDSSNGMRQEEHLIYKLSNQYSTPSVILNLSLRNNNRIYGLYGDKTISNKDFIIDTMSIDYKYNRAEIKLIEKK